MAPLRSWGGAGRYPCTQPLGKPLGYLHYILYGSMYMYIYAAVSAAWLPPRSISLGRQGQADLLDCLRALRVYFVVVLLRCVVVVVVIVVLFHYSRGQGRALRFIGQQDALLAQ